MVNRIIVKVYNLITFEISNVSGYYYYLEKCYNIQDRISISLNIEQLKKDGVPYITATHDINNPRSGAVMKNIGMNYKYSYEEQWQPKEILVTFRMFQLNLDGQDNRIYMEYWDRYSVHYVEENI